MPVSSDKFILSHPLVARNVLLSLLLYAVPGNKKVVVHICGEKQAALHRKLLVASPISDPLTTSTSWSISVLL
jgi:hypothetical protein